MIVPNWASAEIASTHIAKGSLHTEYGVYTSRDPRKNGSGTGAPFSIPMDIPGRIAFLVDYVCCIWLSELLGLVPNDRCVILILFYFILECP